MEGYISKREAVAKLLAKSSSSGSRPDAAGAPDQLSEVAKWQGAAATCLQQLSMWPGSGIALQQQQQEALLHIMANADLHTDGLLASRAYDLLLQNLAKHPPAQLTDSLSSAPQGSSQEQQPPVLQNAALSGTCWVLFNHQGTPLLPDAPSPFQLLQALVQNAVRLAASPCARSSSSSGSGSYGGCSGGASAAGSVKSAAAAAGSQGQALLLLYVVQLLQADLLVRQAAFERYMALSKAVEGEVVQDEARSRAAAALQNSLLHRVMLVSRGYGQDEVQLCCVRSLHTACLWSRVVPPCMCSSCPAWHSPTNGLTGLLLLSPTHTCCRMILSVVTAGATCMRATRASTSWFGTCCCSLPAVLLLLPQLRRRRIPHCRSSSLPLQQQHRQQLETLMPSCRMQAHLLQPTTQHRASPQQQYRQQQPGLGLTRSRWCLPLSWCSQPGCCCCCSCSCTAAVKRRGCMAGAARGATTCSGCREAAVSQTTGDSWLAPHRH